MTFIFNKQSETEKRRLLRHTMPKVEVLIWMHLKGKQLGGYKFRRQYSIGKYVVDFYCPELHLAIELDGDFHFMDDVSVQYDQVRQQWIESLGIFVLRFTNSDVYENIDAVVERIKEIINTKPPLNPLLRKEGIIKDMSIFKAYDIRGVYPSELNEDIAYRVARAMVNFNHANTVAVGSDARISSPSLKRAVMQGIMDEGAQAVDVGLVSTPMFNFSVAAYPEHEAGIMVSASHNPPQYNGLKLCNGTARAIGKETGMPEIEKMVQAMALTRYSVSSAKLKVTKKAIIPAYVQKLFSLVNPGTIKPLTVVVDAANAVGGIGAQAIFPHIPAKLIPLYFELDGTFPHHLGDPLKPDTLADLQKKVQEVHADLGVAYDGDADRIGFVDEHGAIVPMDLVGALLAQEVLRLHKGAGVLHDVRVSNAFVEEVRTSGGVPLRERVGHAYMKQRLAQEPTAVLGVELSGHYYWRDFFNIECTDLAWLMIAALMSKEGKPFSELVKPLRRYAHSGEINFTVADKEAKMQEVLAHYKGQASSIETLDGIRLDFDMPLAISHMPSWWWFSLRASNTEPLLRLNVEASNKEVMEQKRNKLVQFLLD